MLASSRICDSVAERASGPAPAADLLVFTSVGRCECLVRTARGLFAFPAFEQFSRRILAVDGQDPRILQQPELSWFTNVAVSVKRRGYFANIRQAAALIRSPYFFWCEDDWEFTELPPLEKALEAFDPFPNVAQVRIPKQDGLLLEDRQAGRLVAGVWAQNQFYTLNPHYGRTELLRRALEGRLVRGASGENIEVAFSRWMRKEGYISAAWEPRIARAIHFGQQVTGGHTDYRWHIVPEGKEPEGPCQPQPASDRYSQYGPEPAPEVHKGNPNSRSDAPPHHRNIPAELSAKALYALWAVVKAVISIPFSRQARAFVRTIWRYWHPDFRTPLSLGPNCTEAEDVE